MSDSDLYIKPIVASGGAGLLLGFLLAATQTGTDTIMLLERTPNGDENLLGLHWEMGLADEIIISVLAGQAP